MTTKGSINHVGAGRELDRIVAQSVMGRTVSQQKREVFESTEKGTRPLANYTTDISAAWEVAEHMAITLVPIQENSWFALVGRGSRWASPAGVHQVSRSGRLLERGRRRGRHRRDDDLPGRAQRASRTKRPPRKAIAGLTL